MATNTVNISLSDPLKEYVEQRVAGGEFGTPADYIRSLIREDRNRRREQLETQLLEALDSDSIEIAPEELDGKNLVAILREKLT